LPPFSCCCVPAHLIGDIPLRLRFEGSQRHALESRRHGPLPKLLNRFCATHNVTIGREELGVRAIQRGYSGTIPAVECSTPLLIALLNCRTPIALLCSC